MSNAACYHTLWGKWMSLVRVFCMIILLLTIIACNKNDDPPGPDALPEYTVMLYGCAGGNLDGKLDINLQAIFDNGPSDRVKMTGQVKFSAWQQDDPAFSGTRRFAVGKGGPENESVMDIALPMHDPENLADFITWSKIQCPAEKYILVIFGHGSGFDFAENLSRATLSDDNTGTLMSIRELSEGVQRSDTHFEVLYYHSCLMNMLENLGEVAKFADYSLASCHNIPAAGNFAGLLQALDTSDGTVEALSSYGRLLQYQWESMDFPTFDLMATDLRKLPAVFSALREVTDELAASYETYKDEYNSLTGDDFFWFNPQGSSPVFADIADYIMCLHTFSSNGKLLPPITRYFLAAEEAIVYQMKSKRLPDVMHWSTVVINKTSWFNYVEPMGTYSELTFDQATGWSRWFALNEIWHLPSSYQNTP